jgi:hypothetical protein
VYTSYTLAQTAKHRDAGSLGWAGPHLLMQISRLFLEERRQAVAAGFPGREAQDAMFASYRASHKLKQLLRTAGSTDAEDVSCAKAIESPIREVMCMCCLMYVKEL